MQILYLYSELVGYQIPILLEYVKSYNAQVHVVSWDKNKLKPYEPPIHDGITYYKRSEFDIKKLNELADSINPDIIYVSGWMDKGYLNVTKRFKKLGVPVVTAFDDIWEGRLRQRVGALIFPFTFAKCFSHAWVAGAYQYEFAARLGFKRDKIIFEMLSADIKLFEKGFEYLKEKSNDYPKCFLYAGNFRAVKGTDILIKAYNLYRKKYNGKWKLLCVGNGEMQNLLEGNGNIEVIGFSSQTELVNLTKRCGAFILPSRHEQWGLVVQEFAASGMPLLLSEAVGARPSFLIDQYNGYIFKNNSVEDMASAMHKLSQMKTDELVLMSERSNELSKRITPQSSAANFISIINSK